MPQQLLGEPSRQMIGSGGQSGKSVQQRRHNWNDETADLEILCNFTDETLEGKLADEQLRRFLVPTDLTKSDGTGTETMGLLDTTSALKKRSVSRDQIVEKYRTYCLGGLTGC